MSKLIYDNCEIYGPDDKMIGLCSRNRYEWYLNKGLAEKINDKALKLKFTPKPKYNTWNDGTTRSKRENKCYVCGTNDNLTKFHVIPREYKKLFPNEWKSHNSLDILPLCQECSSEALIITNDFKDQLAEEYNISNKNYIDAHKVEIKLLSRKYINNKRNGIDCSKYRQNLQKLLDKHDITEEEIEAYSNIETSIIYKNTKSLQEYIVKNVCAENKLSELIRKFKDNFVESMKPIDLPEDFYIDK